MRLYKGSSSSGKTGVRTVSVKTTAKRGKGAKISPLKFKIPKVKVGKIKI